MTLTRPENTVPTVRVIFRDETAGGNKSLTIYNTTAEAAREEYRRYLESKEQPSDADAAENVPAGHN